MALFVSLDVHIGTNRGKVDSPLAALHNKEEKVNKILEVLCLPREFILSQPYLFRIVTSNPPI